MSTTFKTLVNNLLTTLGASYTAGSGTMTLATGTGALFGSVSAVHPVRFTVVTGSSYGTSYETLTIYAATGIAGDVLSGVAAIEGTTDRNYSAGDKVETRPTQYSYGDIHAAINAIENAPYAVDTAVVHLAGAETISGAKSFSTPPVLGSLAGLIKASSGTLSTAVAGTDFQSAITSSGILKGTGSGSVTAAVAGTDYVTPSGSITGTAGNVTGTVPIANGGTGQTSATAAFNALSPVTTLGDLIFGSGTNSAARLPGNISATRNLLTQTGTGSTSAAPSWGTLTTSDLPAATLLSTATYSNPSWLASIQGSIVTGNISGNAAGITGSVTTSQVSNLGSWTGSTSITTLGTIAAGTWQGNALGTAYGGTGKTTVGTADQLLGVAHTGGALEYKTLTAGSNITITPSAGAITIAASGGSAGGSNTQVQYNSSGALAGSANLTFDGTNLACAGNVSVAGSTPLVQTSSTSLKIRQTGDVLGETGLILENRTGMNGALFYNAGVNTNLVDFQFQNQNTNNFSLRTEGRSTYILGNGNNAAGYSELQLIAAMGGSGTVCGVFGCGSVVLCPSNSGTPLTNPRVGIWQTNPSAMLHVQASAGNRMGAIVQGATSQSSDLTQWQNTTGTVLAHVTANGEISGPLAMSFASKSAAYTATAQDSFFTLSASTAWTLTLPAASSVVSGHMYWFKKTDNTANTITIAAAGTDKIEGASAYSGLSAQYKYLKIVSDGSSNWWNVGSN